MQGRIKASAGTGADMNDSNTEFFECFHKIGANVRNCIQFCHVSDRAHNVVHR